MKKLEIKRRKEEDKEGWVAAEWELAACLVNGGLVCFGVAGQGTLDVACRPGHEKEPSSPTSSCQLLPYLRR